MRLPSIMPLACGLGIASCQSAAGHDASASTDGTGANTFTGSFSPPTRAQPPSSNPARATAHPHRDANAAAAVPRSPFPVPALFLIGIELLGLVAPHQVGRRPALQPLADLAQVAD